jgi:multiple sugar transport system ATP-binding protein
MGRANIRHPRAFLMDEPLSNLDAKLRIQMRVELVRLHRRLGVTTIYVTHDQTEAMTLGQRVTVLNHGRVQQVAPPRELYLQPVNAFVAGFIGSPPMNFFRGRLTGDGIDLNGIPLKLPSEIMARVTPGDPQILLGLRPESLSIVTAEGALQVEVEVVEQLGAESFLYLRLKGLTAVEQSDRPSDLSGSVCARLNEMADLRPGDRVSLAVQPNLVHLFDAKSGESRLVVC